MTWKEHLLLFLRGLPWPQIFWLDANMASLWGNILDIFPSFNCYSPSSQLRKWKLLKMEKEESVTIARKQTFILIYFQSSEIYNCQIFELYNLWKSNLLCRGNSCARCPRQLGLLMLEIRTRPDKESKKCFAIYLREKECLPGWPAWYSVWLLYLGCLPGWPPWYSGYLPYSLYSGHLGYLPRWPAWWSCRRASWWQSSGSTCGYWERAQCQELSFYSN